MLSTITFANSIFLLLGIPSLLGLVYAYRKGGRLQKRMVNSILILQKLSFREAARKKPVFPWRFLVDLLFILLILLAGAGLLLREEGRRVVLLIDNSFSLSARSQPVVGADSNFKLLKLEVAKALQNLESSDLVKVYVSSPNLRSLAEHYTSSREAGNLISALQYVFSGDELEAQIGSLVQAESPDKLVVFTDKSLGFEPRGVVSYLSLAEKGEMLSKENIWIRDLQVLPAGKIQVDLASINEGMVDAEVSLQKLNPNTLTLEASNISKRAKVSSGKGSKILLEGLDGGGTYFLSLESSSGLLHDSIDLDNAIYFTYPSDFGLFSVRSSKPLVELGLSGMKNYGFRAIGDGEEVKTAAAIFDKVELDSIPSESSLIVSTGDIKDQIQVKPYRGVFEISRWHQGHPLNDYVEFSNLALGDHLTYTDYPSWMTPVLYTTAGPVMLAGENRGKRYVLCGFDLFPFLGRKEASKSILLLNVLKWLSAREDAEVFWSIKQSFKVPSDISSIVRLGGESLKLNRGIRFPKPGIYELYAGSKKASVLAVSFLDSKESDLSKNILEEPSNLDQQPVNVLSSSIHSDSYSLKRLILRVLLLLLVVDVLLMSLRYWRKQLGVKPEHI